MGEFKLVNDYMLHRLGTKNIDNGLSIIETQRRHKCEISYGNIHMIWIVNFEDGSIVASVPLNISKKIKSFLCENTIKYDIYDDLFISPLKKLADMEAKKIFEKESCGCSSSIILACNAETIASQNPNVQTKTLNVVMM